MKMNVLKKLKWIICGTSLLLLVVGCGKYINDTAPDTEMGTIGQMAECNNTFADLFEKDITGDLKCLQDKLHSISETLKPVVPGSLSQQNLEYVIDELRLANPERTKKGLRVLFKLNYLLMAGNPQSITISNLDAIFDFLKKLNSTYVHKIKPALDYEEATEESGDKSHRKYRDQLVGNIGIIVDSLDSIFIRGRHAKINIEADLLKNLQNEDNENFVEKVKSYLFFKKIIFGGDKERLWSKDIETLMDILPSLAGSFFDIIKMGKIKFAQNLDDDIIHDKNEYRKFELLKRAVNNVEALLPSRDTKSREVIFTVDELLNLCQFLYDNPKLDENGKALESVIPDPSKDREGFKKMIIDIKEKFLNGDDSDGFTQATIDKTFDLLKEVSVKLKVFYKLYSHTPEIKKGLDYSKNQIKESDAIVESIKSVGFDEADELEYKDDFLRVIMNYRFFDKLTIDLDDLLPAGMVGESDNTVMVPFFGYDFKRTKSGVAGIGLLEHVVVIGLTSLGQTSAEMVQDYKDRCNKIKRACSGISRKLLKSQEAVCIGGCKSASCEEYNVPTTPTMPGYSEGNKVKCATLKESCEKYCEMPREISGMPELITLQAGGVEYLTGRVNVNRLSHTYCKKIKKDKAGACKIAKDFKGYKDPFGHDIVVHPRKLKQSIQMFAPILKQMDMINPLSVTGQSKTMRLICDLFQTQSNGDGVLGVNEFVEYFSTGMIGRKFVDTFHREVGRTCEERGDILNADGDPTESCASTVFWEKFLLFKEFMPGLEIFLNDPDKNPQEQLIVKKGYYHNLMNFAVDPCYASFGPNGQGDCDNPYMNKRDFLLIMGAMFNIETLIFKYDRLTVTGRGDGVLDYDELRKAYDVSLNKEIKSYISGLPEGWDGIAFLGLLYLVQYGEMPDPLLKEFLRFIIKDKKKDIVAGRSNIGDLLRFIADPRHTKDIKPRKPVWADSK